MLLNGYPWYVWAAFLGLINGVVIPVCVGLISGDWRWLLITALCSFILWLWLMRA